MTAIHYIVMGDEQKRLPRDIQISLGRKLRDIYRAYVGLPFPLLGLARRIPEPSSFKTHREMPPQVYELSIVERDVLDPETIRILVDAYNKAWNDLRTLKKNPATNEALARMLSHLATKAVLKLIERG